MAETYIEIGKLRGPEGARGPRGDVGPKGTDGANGAQGPQGVRGERGYPGTFHSAGATTLPANQAARVEMTGDELYKHAQFFIPRGLPGVNGLENDEAVAAYMYAGLSSAAGAALVSILRADTGLYSISHYPGTDALKLQAAIDDAVQAGEEREVFVPDGTVLDRKITWDIGYVSLRFGGRVTSTVADGPTFHVMNSKTGTNASTGLTANANKSLTGLHLKGPGSGSVGSVAFLFDSSAGNARGVTFYDVEIYGFETEIQIKNNAYLLTFMNVHLWGYDVAVDMPSGAANYGENIRFIASTIGSGRLAVRNSNPNGDIYFLGCSFDFMNIVAEARAGLITFSACHIELRENDVTAPIMTTHVSRAGIMVLGGRMMFHQGTTTADYLFSTEGAEWGMGITLRDVETFSIRSRTGILCGGTGMLYTQNLRTMDSSGGGFSGESVLTSMKNNMLIDPTFGAAGNDYSVVRDAFQIHDTATSRTHSPDMRLSQIAPGRLVVERLATGFATSFAIDIPLTGDLAKEWAAGFTVSAGPSSGRFSVREGFVACRQYDSRGIPMVLKSDMRSESEINLSGAQYPVTRRYGYTAFDRHERPWATHFRLLFNIAGIAQGGTLNFGEIIITPR